MTRKDPGGAAKVIAQIAYNKSAGTATLTDGGGASHVYVYDPLRIWQSVEDPDTQSPLPTVMPVTSLQLPVVPDPLKTFFQRVLGKQ